MIEFLPLIIGVLLAQISPGPNMMAVSAFSLRIGRKAGILTATGVATGVFIWAILFSLGIGAFLSSFPETIFAMKLIGGSYLLFMAFKALKSARISAPAMSETMQSAPEKSQAYFTGLLVVLTNPKAVLMWAAIAMFLASTDMTIGQFILFGLCASMSAMVIYGTYAVLFSTGVALRIYGRFFRFVEASFGIIFGAIGAKLLVDVVKELRN